MYSIPKLNIYLKKGPSVLVNMFLSELFWKSRLNLMLACEQYSQSSWWLYECQNERSRHCESL